jgi:hypothetical protein
MKVANFEVLPHGCLRGAIGSMTHGALAREKVFCGSILRYRPGSQGNHQKYGQCNCVFHSVSFDSSKYL